MNDALAQGRTGTEDAHAGVVGGDASLARVVLHRGAVHVDAAQRHGVLGLQGLGQARHAPADGVALVEIRLYLLVELTRELRKRAVARTGPPKMVEDCIAQHAVEPRDRGLLALERHPVEAACECFLQHVFGHLAVADAILEEGEEGAAVLGEHSYHLMPRRRFSRFVTAQVVFQFSHAPLPSVMITARAGAEPDRDAHLRSADFLDVERHPEIRFRGGVTRRLGALDFTVTGDLTIRGITRPAVLEVHSLGRWTTPWWEGGVDKGPKLRAGFVAETTINRQDFGVSWNSALDLGGVVVGDEVRITIDAEAILEED